LLQTKTHRKKSMVIFNKHQFDDIGVSEFRTLQQLNHGYISSEKKNKDSF
jgi:hypothetical protein